MSWPKKSLQKESELGEHGGLQLQWCVVEQGMPEMGKQR